MTAPDWPRMMRRATAAAYCDLKPADFERAFSEGVIPLPVKVAGIDLWSRVQLDEHLGRLTGEKTPDWRAGSKLYASG